MDCLERLNKLRKEILFNYDQENSKIVLKIIQKLLHFLKMFQTLFFGSLYRGSHLRRLTACFLIRNL